MLVSLEAKQLSRGRSGNSDVIAYSNSTGGNVSDSCVNLAKDVGNFA